MNSILLQSCIRQKKQPAKDIQTNTRKEKYFNLPLTNLQDIDITEKENVFVCIKYYFRYDVFYNYNIDL